MSIARPCALVIDDIVRVAVDAAALTRVSILMYCAGTVESIPPSPVCQPEASQVTL